MTICFVCKGIGYNNVYYGDYNLWKDAKCSKCNGIGVTD